MTTKLIQELVGLAVEKELDFSNYENEFSVESLLLGTIVSIDLDDEDAPAQLQAAIDKVKVL